jgi:cell division protease FtsH
MRYGMSDEVGPMVYGRKDELVFLGKEFGEQRDYGEAMARTIDNEVRNFIMRAYERAKQVMMDSRTELDRVAEALLDRETLSAEEFVAAMQGRPLPERKEKKSAPEPQDEHDAPEPKPEPVLKPSTAAA